MADHEEPSDDESSIQEFPTARSGAVMFEHNDELYLWGGMTQEIIGEGEDTTIMDIDLPDIDTEDEPQYLEIFNLQTHVWRRQMVEGNIPYKCRAAFHTVVGNTLYLYGGAGEGISCNLLYSLDLITFKWELVSDGNRLRSPTKKCLGRMVSFDNKLYPFGGSGKKENFSENHGAEFVPNDTFRQSGDEGWNNALHEFDVKNGTWREISTDIRPPPCDKFTFNQIDKERAILFGGKQSKYQVTFNHVFIFHCKKGECKWEGPYLPQPGQKWPKARALHSAACLIDPNSEHAIKNQQLIVIWGQGPNARHVGDIWILHIDTMTWRELKISLRPRLFNQQHYLQPRMYHMSCSYHTSDRQTDVIVYGGNKQRKSKFERHVKTDLVIFRFGSVESLQSMCMTIVREFQELVGYHLPPSIKSRMSSEKDSNCKIFYPHDTDLISPLVL